MDTLLQTPRPRLAIPAPLAPVNDNIGGAGPEPILWRPEDGEDTIIGGGGDTVCIQARGVTLPQLLTCILAEPGCPPPRLRDGWIEITGIHGRVVLNDESLHFCAMERLVLRPD